MQRGSTATVGQDSTAVSGLAWVVGVCAVVLTAWLLGAAWLTWTMLGVPAGLWIIGMVLGGRWLLGRMAGEVPFASISTPAIHSEEFQNVSDDGGEQTSTTKAQQTLELPSMVPLPRQALATVSDGALTIIRSCSDGQLPAWLERMRTSGGTPGASLSRPLRIGVQLPDEHFRALERAPGALSLSLARFHDSGDPAVWRRLGFDAMIEQHTPDGPLVIRVAESPDDPAAWHDWASALPLSYSSLFPLRIDAATVTLSTFDWADQGAIPVLRSLLEAAALLGRYPSRLDFGDRLRGRPALGLMLGSPVVSDPALDRVFRQMASVLGDRRPDQVGQAEFAAMRTLAGYLAWTGCGLLPEDRVNAARVINRLGPAEGETCLRACVAAFAGGQEVLGFDLMLTGHERLSIERPEPLVDPMEYLLSDIAYNRGGAETLGKLAAGLAYATALIDRPRVAYVLDDVCDEVMTAEWLTVNPDVRDQVLAMIEALSTVRSIAA